MTGGGKMLTKVYISVSDEQEHLTVDGSLELFRQLLSVLRKSEDGQPTNAPTQESHAAGRDYEEVNDE